MLHTILTIAGLLSVTSAMTGQNRDPLHYQEKMLGLDNVASNYSNSTFEVKLDNFNATETRTLRLRYWKNEMYFNASSEKSPIFIYICGEWTCRPPSDSAAAMAFGASKNALLLTLEHRYFGNSQPFTDAQGGWSYDNLQYLSVYQAIEDIDAFITSVKKEYGNRKVLIIGGSYPGAVVAWFKVAHPSSVDAVWSSSGVIHAIDNFFNFDYDVYLTTMNSSQNCTETIQIITNEIDMVWLNGTAEEKAYLFDRFAVTNPNMTYGDFMYYLADIWTGAIQNGQRTEMCKFITSEDFQVDTWRKLYTYQFKNGETPRDVDRTTHLESTRVDHNLNMRQWTYQTCTEFGWWQVPNDIGMAMPMRSESLQLPFWNELCKEVYSQNIPATKWEEINEKYGALNMVADNVYFFTAHDDPWQYAGMRKLDDPRQKNMRTWYVDCTDCSHCVDLHSPSPSDPQSLKDGRADAIKTISGWMGLDDEEEVAEEIAFLQD